MQDTTKKTILEQIKGTVTNEGVIIGVTIGAVLLVVLIIVIVICCCCRKAERSCLKRSLKKMDKRLNRKKRDLEIQQQGRREEMNQRHNEIRNKYGLRTNPDIEAAKDNIFTVENEQISLSLR
ncbi:unnamed protein product [Brachionus calyciflorus]|uniref:Uncharacterized protein n=1 Tax=Brachionus calyciflorus TaxID=104777 RepID=A0A814BXY5_9BILA|nr:unnamed protein product [Brachionus calyciflorus]